MSPSEGPMRVRRNKTARELADKFGVSPRTIQRMVAQSREDYLAEAAARHERIRAMRAEGMTMRAIAEREGVTARAVHYAIHKNDPPRTPDASQAPKTDASDDA